MVFIVLMVSANSAALKAAVGFVESVIVYGRSRMMETNECAVHGARLSCNKLNIGCSSREIGGSYLNNVCSGVQEGEAVRTVVAFCSFLYCHSSCFCTEPPLPPSAPAHTARMPNRVLLTSFFRHVDRASRYRLLGRRLLL